MQPFLEPQKALHFTYAEVLPKTCKHILINTIVGVTIFKAAQSLIRPLQKQENMFYLAVESLSSQDVEPLFHAGLKVKSLCQGKEIM